MRYLIPILILALQSLVFAGEDCRQRFNHADSLLKAGNVKSAYIELKDIAGDCDYGDSLYSEIYFFYVSATTYLEKEMQKQEKWKEALKYGLETVELIEKGVNEYGGRVTDNFIQRKYWMYKDIIVAYYGLNKLDKAQEFKNKLYEAHGKKLLPEGIDKYFNFEFFKIDGKNVWGYEWYPVLGDPETEGSFSKVVYYVYSTNPDGSDKDQLYRLHVLKFHKISDDVKFDYVLTKRLDKAQNEPAGTLYAYTYQKKIDFKKLRADIRKVIQGKYK